MKIEGAGWELKLTPDSIHSQQRAVEWCPRDEHCEFKGYDDVRGRGIIHVIRGLWSVWWYDPSSIHTTIFIAQLAGSESRLQGLILLVILYTADPAGVINCAHSFQDWCGLQHLITPLIIN